MSQAVIDTQVLVRANGQVADDEDLKNALRHRLRLLGRILGRELTVLVSAKLLAEYADKVREPRNDWVRAFLELLASPNANVVTNWADWPAGRRDAARKCRFPKHDQHLLRTALRDGEATVVTEESALLKTDACIHREFRIHVRKPAEHGIA